MKFSPLRDQILTLALTGQLVEQRAAEPEVQQIGPAPAPDEVPFAIPAKWKWVRLDDLADSIKYGYTASATDIGNAKFLRITDLKDGKVDWALVPFCEIDHKNLANMKLEPNDILIARSGAGSVGKSYVVENLEQGVDAVFASYLLRVRLKHDAPVWAMYVKHYLRSPIYWAAISQHARGSTGLINVNVKQLASLLLPLPPLEEQWRIVAVLDDLMARLDQMEQAYSELTGPMSDHLRNLVLQQAISEVNQ